ncbi:MAG: hypothetical protein WCT52_06320 [Candidatus Micrarchaeia archaeon]
MTSVAKETDKVNGKTCVKTDKTQLPRLNGFAPLTERALMKEFFVILDLNSTTQEKAAMARDKKARTEHRVEFAMDKYKKVCEAKGEESPEAAKAKSESDFYTGMLDFMEMQLSGFIGIKKKLNTQKDNIQKAYDARINSPRYYELLQKYVPWLAGAGLVAGASTFGADLWKGAIEIAQKIVPLGAQIVKDAMNLIGLGALAGAIGLLNKAAAKRREKLFQMCEDAKSKIDAAEFDIKRSILELGKTEYGILAREFGYSPVESESPSDHVRAREILNGVKVKYGFSLPYPHVEDMSSVAMPHEGRAKMLVRDIWAALSKFVSPPKPIEIEMKFPNATPTPSA